jgi:hypothetical protein
VNSRALTIGGYRYRSTFRNRWPSYVALALFIAILGGVAMGTVAGARRTESSFGTLLNRSDSSQLEAPLQFYNPQAGFNSGYSPSAIEKLRSLAHVTNVESIVGVNAYPLGPHGQTVPGDNGFAPEGSVDGLELNEDRLIINRGRLPDPRRADEFVADTGSVREFGWHLGQTVTFAYYTNAASVAAANTGPKVAGTFKVKLVGVGAIQPGNVVQDQVDNVDLAIVLFTPALTRHYLSCCASNTIVGIQLSGTQYEAQVVKSYEHLFPKVGSPPQTEASVENRVARSISPEALALGVFGLLTALAALAISAQLISRMVRRASDDARILRAMGADPRTTMVDGLLGATSAILLGSLGAVVVAIALSPLAPIGPIRAYLGASVEVDWTVLGVGLAFFVLVLGSLASIFTYRGQPHHGPSMTLRSSRSLRSPTRVAGSTGLPIAAATGVGFALESGGTRRGVSMRSAILGAAIALTIVGATTTFASSLHTLVSNPPLYGWNWNVAINGGGGVGDLPKQLFAPLKKDPDIAATSNAYFATLPIDGVSVPVMGEDPGALIQPPLLSGHGFDAANQIVLGSSTLQELHKSVGESVVVTSGGSKRTSLTIVGTATMPAFGQSGQNHLEMGTGAVLDYALIPLFKRDVYDLPPGPNAILVRYRSGVSDAQGKKSILHAVAIASGGAAQGNLVQNVQRPAEIVDYRSLGNTPIELGAVLCGGALVGLGLTLLSSVRRRRRDVALLKALGFSRRQVVIAIAVQSTIAVGLGAVIGIPVGVIAGRSLWSFFANAIHAVPIVVVPISTLLLIAVAALVLANLVAVFPARLAARTSPAMLLRAE